MRKIFALAVLAAVMMLQSVVAWSYDTTGVESKWGSDWNTDNDWEHDDNDWEHDNTWDRDDDWDHDKTWERRNTWNNDWRVERNTYTLTGKAGVPAWARGATNVDKEYERRMGTRYKDSWSNDPAYTSDIDWSYKQNQDNKWAVKWGEKWDQKMNSWSSKNNNPVYPMDPVYPDNTWGNQRYTDSNWGSWN